MLVFRIQLTHPDAVGASNGRPRPSIGHLSGVLGSQNGCLRAQSPSGASGQVNFHCSQSRKSHRAPNLRRTGEGSGSMLGGRSGPPSSPAAFGEEFDALGKELTGKARKARWKGSGPGRCFFLLVLFGVGLPPPLLVFFWIFEGKGLLLWSRFFSPPPF